MSTSGSMYRISLLLFALFASVLVTIAVPISETFANSTVTLEKRITHVGRWVEIVNTKNGKKAYGKTRDSCESCGDSDLGQPSFDHFFRRHLIKDFTDMSPSLFQKLDSLSVGQLTVSWHFMAKGWSP
ncbi:hypothetical protein C0995_013851 [Termitomyces sp. Mi166|nr:hypothetical protein C0995_013851 [Termitomyces sp. Mi166\